MKYCSRVLKLTILVAALGLSACNCGDTVAVRTLNITQWRGNQTWGPYEVDVAPSLVESRKEHQDGCGNPVTELQLATTQPVKIMIVPATQP
jgi:hypothetical protein